jgi:hypothetical protein
MKPIFTLLLSLFFISLNLFSQTDKDLFLWWDFDDSKEITDPSYSDMEEEGHFATTKEKVQGMDYNIIGLGKYVPGVKGTAFKFDGFSSYIEGIPEIDYNEDEEIEFPREISIETWISLGAYPWNWAPIVTIGQYKITGFYFGIDSRGRIGFHMSDATSVWHECNSHMDQDTRLGLELRKWYHVVATYSPVSGIKLYINGQLENTYNDFTFNYGIAYSQIEKGFRLGMNRIDLPPSDPIRDWATYPSRYSLDGIIDETRIYNKVLTEGEIQARFHSVQPENNPDFTPRKFPVVKGYGKFTANYTRLKYYPEWDALWPAGDHMDVVVQFDRTPVKLMFWRGTRYSACWVSENGKWMADQSRETGNNWFLSQGSREEMPTGCIEHMSDVQTRSSRVAIVEKNDARITVNWRYLQMDVKFRQLDLPNNTGFGEWGNELYYIYPDGIAVRKVLPGRGGWQETIFLNEPGTRPEDNIELMAATLMNLKGESKTYSWADGYPEFDLPDANIQIVNLKSAFKPFIVFVENGGFEVFNLEVRPQYSHFPWWNHWPVAQIISDGRSASAPDRAAHSSLSWGDPNADYALYGMASDSETVLKVARSWNRPASLNVQGNIENQDFDKSQRAYVLKALDNQDIIFSLDGSADSPVYNPAFIIKNCAAVEPKCFINDKQISKEDFEYGVEYDVNGIPETIIWLKLDAERKIEVKFEL